MVFQGKCVVLSDFLFCPTFIRQWLLIDCICVPSFQNSFARTILWKFGFSQNITCSVTHYLTHWLTMHGTTGLYVSRNRQWVKSVYVQLSISFRWLHAFSACAENDTNILTDGAIWTLSLRRSLVELEDFVVARFSNKILRFLTEVVDLHRFLKVPSATFSCLGDYRVAQLIVELFLFDLFQLVQQRNVECQGFENQHNGHCHRSPCADELHSHGHRIFSILKHVHPSERVARSAQVLREVTWVTWKFCSIVLPLFSCKPLYRYKSLVVCLKE